MKRVIVWLLIAALLLPCSALAIHPAFFASSGQSFYAPLTTTIVQTLGAGSPTFTRTTTAWVQDFEGLFKQVKSGESRFEGARRVENLVSTKSEDISNAAWTKTNGSADSAVRFRATAGNATCYQSRTESGHTYRLRAKIKRVTGTGNIQLTLDNSSFTTITLTDSYQIFSISGAVTNPNYGVRIVTSGDTIDITEIQLTQVTGQTNQNPSEYVSVGVLSAPFHGANVDGVKYFDYQNGNTVDGSGVVTEAQGSAISTSTLKGVLIEGQRTNSILQSRQFDTTWNTGGTTPTLAKDQVGIAGTPNTAWALGDDDGGGVEYIRQSVTIANDSNTHTVSLYIKKDSNTTRYPAFYMSLAGGATPRNHMAWLNTSTGATVNESGLADGIVTVTSVNSAWWRISIASANNTTGNTSLTLYIQPARGTVIGTTSNAATGTIVIDQAQVELNVSFPSSPIPTTTGSVTRNADNNTRPTAGIWNTNNMSGVMQWTPLRASMGTVYLSGLYVDANNSFGIFHDGTNITVRKRIGGTNYDATYALAYTAGTTYKIGWRISSTSGVDVFVNGVKGTNHANTTAISSIPTNFAIGQDGNSASYGFASFKNRKIWKRALPDARMIQETTP